MLPIKHNFNAAYFDILKPLV